MSQPLRVTFLQTHPIQYMAPWFRHVAAHRPDIALTVLYAAEPTAEQQGVGFDTPFEWDTRLTDGYANRVLLPAAPGRRFDDRSRGGVDVPDVGPALEATRPDAAVVPGWHSRFYLRALDACRRAGIPVLYRGDSSFLSAPRGLRRRVWAWQTRRRLRRFDAYLSVGRCIDTYLEAFGAPPHTVFRSPAAVDNALFAADADRIRTGDRDRRRAELGVGPGDFLILFAGKFVSRKRPGDVIAAAHQLGGGVVVAMAGGGPLAADVQADAARLGVRLAWRGFLNQADLRVALAVADCVAVPSLWETWGLIVNEALAAGTPCVVSLGVAAHADLIATASGGTHPAGDVAALAAALDAVRRGLASGEITAAMCRAAVAPWSFSAATDGLAAATRSVMRRTARADTRNSARC